MGNILLIIYFAFGFLIWNVGILKSQPIQEYSLIKQIGFVVFCTVFWGVALVVWNLKKLIK